MSWWGNCKDRTIRGDLQFGTIPGTTRADFECWCDDFSGLIARAQKFDFDKAELWELPYPAVWFEGVSLFSGGARAGVYCYADPRDPGSCGSSILSTRTGNWFNGWITAETPLRLTTAPTNTLKLMRVGWVRYHQDALRTHECAIRLVLNAVAALSAHDNRYRIDLTASMSRA